MELDDLKPALNRRLEDVAASPMHAWTDRPSKSRSLLSKLRRNLWVEMGMYVVCLVFTGWQMYVARHPALRIYDATLMLGTLAVMWRLRLIIRRIDRHRGSDVSVRERLASLLEILEANGRKYLYFSVGVVPFSTLYAFLLFYFVPGPEASVPAVSSADGRAEAPAWVYATVAFLVTALLTGLVYLLTRLYIWWMFGKYIRGLRESLNDIESGSGE